MPIESALVPIADQFAPSQVYIAGSGQIPKYNTPNISRSPQAQMMDQPQQQQGGGLNLNMLNQFTGGGAAGGDVYGFGAADPFATSSYAGGEGALAGGEAAGGGFGEMASSAGPWALLAAAIISNEYNAKKGGYRNEDDWGYAQDVIGGKVLEQDLNQRWLPQIFGEDLKNDSTGIGSDMKFVGELNSLDFGNALEALKEGTIGKLLGGLF